MVLYEVFRQHEICRFRAQIYSKATLFSLFCLLILILAPLGITYLTYGFWIRHASYIKMPNVAFKDNYIISLITQDGNTYLSSSYFNLNELMMANIRNAIVNGDDKDIDFDGLNDYLTFSAEIPLDDTDKVISASLILVFAYDLNKYGAFNMESLGYISYASDMSGSMMNAIGDLEFVQYSALSYKGSDLRYNYPVVNSSKIYASKYAISSILEEYSARNITAKINNQYVYWKPNRPPGQPFKISVQINYRPAYVLYTPGFYYVMKWAWVQFISVFLIFAVVVDRLMAYAFQNHFVSSVVQKPIFDCQTFAKNL